MDDSGGENKRKTPARYRLYDGIKDKVSLRTMDFIIYTIIALIVAALLFGMFRG